MRPIPLVFVGTATLDTIAVVDRFPRPDERLVVDDLVTAGGGPAATAAVTAARLGHRTAFVGTVGDDADGDTILAGLAEVDTSGVTRRGRSAASVVVVARHGATRAILHRPAAGTDLSHLGLALCLGSTWIHVDQAGWPVIDGWWRSTPGRPRLSVDAGNPVEGCSVDGVDLYVPTISSLRERYGDLGAAALLGAAVEEGARLVVATDGSSGAYVLGRDHPFVHVPTAPGEIRSTLGAGDVFHGALLAGIAGRLDPIAATAFASRIAVASCAGIDGRSSVPRIDLPRPAEVSR
jgi:sulfofructose kinase